MNSWPLALLFVVALPAASLAQTPEPKPVPKGSVEVLATGCLKGRAFTAIAPRQEADVARGPDVTGRTFRVEGKKEVMKDVKAHNGHLVQVVGLVRTSALADNAPGRRIGNTRVVIGSPGGSDPLARPRSAPIVNVVVMDLESVRYIDDECPIGH